MSQHTNERTNDAGAPVWYHHPSADTPAESELGEFPPFDTAELAASSLVRMDAAEAAADALSKYAHLLPTYATEAHEAAASWRLARSL